MLGLKAQNQVPTIYRFDCCENKLTIKPFLWCIYVTTRVSFKVYFFAFVSPETAFNKDSIKMHGLIMGQHIQMLCISVRYQNHAKVYDFVSDVNVLRHEWHMSVLQICPSVVLPVLNSFHCALSPG
jgi:hypothetical protein